uniref:Uncharacterized protein n=1 Tax=Anser cygnoides TaxID=8845 RepID=A0A8B9EFQ8_ANSCY
SRHSLPQPSSSEPSRQSGLPSQRQRRWMHSPLPQGTCSGGQVAAGSRGPQTEGHSSEPSGQSASPSQRHKAATQLESLQAKSWGSQVAAGGHPASSAPSSQSLPFWPHFETPSPILRLPAPS